jgi:cytochrome c-type biogenesis protein CcmI
VTLVLFAALLAAAAAAFVVRPLWARRTAMLVDTAPGALLDAEARRRVTLASLKELEYDYLGGKLDQADYETQRERLSREALAALRAAEAVQAEFAVPGEGVAVPRIVSDAHACGFVNPAGSRFCAGCGARLR